MEYTAPRNSTMRPLPIRFLPDRIHSPVQVARFIARLFGHLTNRHRYEHLHDLGTVRFRRCHVVAEKKGPPALRAGNLRTDGCSTVLGVREERVLKMRGS